ncbi:hypothetical protein [Gorillibacterium timonense]|uniref:hypothetical protein n=1 Tax=Gorillibacterium timonense TaxID=1689269 RepID=UPI00071D1E26|nr:hypothetical protein [Gorillibacterium timonense]
MPHITFGGKYVYGWLTVNDDGSILLPQEALMDYQLIGNKKVLLMSGSRTSKGFSVMSLELMKTYESHMLTVVAPALEGDDLRQDEVFFRQKGRTFASAGLDNEGRLSLPDQAKEAFGIHPDSRLLSIRSSNVAFVNIFEGPIVERARQHSELPVFEA